ncbi:MAG TPA: TPM domain-containing protein [Caulobacteraceae bacterium]|nr:TPM domain-containing protein [Caulobacteraceae bacterium]
MRSPRQAAGLILSLAFALGVLTLGAAARAAPTFPAFTGRVVDQAHVLSPDAQAQLDQELGALEAKTSRQVVVVTLASLQGYDIADYGYQLGRAWGVGQKGLDNGALLIVAPNEHQVRIEVGYGLEPILTDALSSQILQEAVIPKFRQGDIQGGVLDGAQALVQQLSLDTSTAEAKAAQARAVAQAPSASARIGSSPLAVLVVGFILFWAVGSVLGGGGRGGLGWIFPLLFLGGLGGGGGRYRNDDFGGGGFGGGGGGFSGGGGGSFGGGGSSGNW